MNNSFLLHIKNGQPHFRLVESEGRWHTPEWNLAQADYRALLPDGSVLHFLKIANIDRCPGQSFAWFELPDQDDLLSSLRFLPSVYGRRWICSIAGCKESSKKFSPVVQEAAIQAGRMAALLGWTVLTGGLSGVMSRAAEGARSVGGATVGLLPGEQHSDANRFIDFVLPTGIGYARNYLLAMASDAMISLPGGTGTLEEMCFALDFKRPVISWGGWEVEDVKAIPLDQSAAVRERLIEIMKEKFKTQFLEGEK